jgi:hypothetical protein
MYGIAPSVVYDEMDARDVGALFMAGIRFEQCRGAIWLSSLGGIGTGLAVPISAAPYGAPPANPDEYQAPDREGFADLMRKVG